MWLFELATILLMTAVVYIGNFTNIAIRQKIQKAIPYVVVFIGVLFILRGLGVGISYIFLAKWFLLLLKTLKTVIKIYF